MLKEIIEDESYRPWTSNILVMNKNETIRFYIDY
jgi:hypothetical protein